MKKPTIQQLLYVIAGLLAGLAIPSPAEINVQGIYGIKNVDRDK